MAGGADDEEIRVDLLGELMEAPCGRSGRDNVTLELRAGRELLNIDIGDAGLRVLAQVASPVADVRAQDGVTEGVDRRRHHTRAVGRRERASKGESIAAFIASVVSDDDHAVHWAALRSRPCPQAK